MSEVKQTIPGVKLLSPYSCLVYWAPRGLAKILQYIVMILPMGYTSVSLWLVLLYPNILGLIVGFYITT